MRYQAVIIKYSLDDLHFDQDEASEWFDGITLKILSPNSLKEKKIYIFHEEMTMEENPWKITGRIVEFDYDDELGDFDKYDIFTSSLKNVTFRK